MVNVIEWASSAPLLTLIQRTYTYTLGEDCLGALHGFGQPLQGHNDSNGTLNKFQLV